MLKFNNAPKIETRADFERAKARLAYLIEKTCMWTSDETTELAWLKEALEKYEPVDEHETFPGAAI